MVIVLDLTRGNIGSLQYHPDAGWLKANGYSNEQPWVILHEAAHAYHDQAQGFDEPRIKENYEKHKNSGRGDKVLHNHGTLAKHHSLTDTMEYFAEMTAAYFGVNDFFPFNRAEFKENEPAICEVMMYVRESPAKPEPKISDRKKKDRR